METLRRKAEKEKERLEAGKAESEKVSKSSSLGFLSFSFAIDSSPFFFLLIRFFSNHQGSFVSWVANRLDSLGFGSLCVFVILVSFKKYVLESCGIGSQFYYIGRPDRRTGFRSRTIPVSQNQDRFWNSGSGCGSNGSGSNCQFFLLVLT